MQTACQTCSVTVTPTPSVRWRHCTCENHSRRNFRRYGYGTYSAVERSSTYWFSVNIPSDAGGTHCWDFWQRFLVIGADTGWQFES